MYLFKLNNMLNVNSSIVMSNTVLIQYYMYLFKLNNMLNVNSSIVMSNTEHGAKFTRKQSPNTKFAESRRLFRVNSYYLGLIMFASFIMHTHDPSPQN